MNKDYDRTVTVLLKTSYLDIHDDAGPTLPVWQLLRKIIATFIIQAPYEVETYNQWREAFPSDVVLNLDSSVKEVYLWSYYGGRRYDQLFQILAIFVRTYQGRQFRYSFVMNGKTRHWLVSEYGHEAKEWRGGANFEIWQSY